MKKTGIVRPIDDLGRIVFPKELRDMHGWVPGTRMEIYLTEEGVLFKEFMKPNYCAICKSQDESKLINVLDQHICHDCLRIAHQK